MGIDELENEIFGDEKDIDLEDDNTNLGEEEKKKETSNNKGIDPNIINDLKSKIEEQNSKLAEFDAFKNRLVGEKPKDNLEMEREQFEEDPKGFYEKKFKEVESNLRTEMVNREVTSQVMDATKELEREFDVNWNKDQEKIINIVNMFAKDVKQKDPKGVLRKAFVLAGIKQKDDIYKIPYSELGINTQMQEKKQQEDNDRIKDSIINVSKNKVLDLF